MGTHIPNVRTLPPNCGIKIVSSVVSKTITSRFGTNFIFGSSGEDLVQAASMLALLGRKFHFPPFIAVLTLR